MATTHDIIDPATEATLATFELAGADEVDEAVAAATAAFPAWSAVGTQDRVRLLRRYAEALAGAAAELAATESANVGKTIPMLIASWKLGPALACGNTVVIKPSQLTPLTTVRLGELALDAGLPEGVVNVVVGDGATAGQRILDHPA